MTYKTGVWGEQAKIRSKKRLEYFKEYNKKHLRYIKKFKIELTPEMILLKKEKRKLQKRISRISSVKKLRWRVLDKLGNKCVKCGFTDWRALQFDHINGGGFKDRKIRKLDQWKLLKDILNNNINKYQILCANCNWIKRYENNENRKF